MCIAAIAIEDRVDVLIRDHFLDDKTSVEFRLSEPVPEGSDYFAEVCKLIEQSFGLLINHSKFTGNARELFNALESVVISIPGVIEDNHTLLQLPLWHSPTSNVVQWKHRGVSRTYFDFAEELTLIADGMIKKGKDHWGERERKRFKSRIFVVNDATASAVFEFIKRREEASKSGESTQIAREAAADFIYFKIHNGLNVGVVERSDEDKVEVKTVHAEAGHGFPRLHSLDIEAGFSGVCHFHGDCFEGMVAGHSFYKRAETDHPPVFRTWNDFLKRQKNLTGTALDNKLIAFVLGGTEQNPAGDGEGVDLIAHYIAQAVFQLSISPLSPKQIVLGGQMATPAVISAIRQKVLGWSNGYPQRPQLTDAGIGEHIKAALATASERSQIEVRGALTLAFSRASHAIGNSNGFIKPAIRIELTEVPPPQKIINIRDFKKKS